MNHYLQNWLGFAATLGGVYAAMYLGLVLFGANPDVAKTTGSASFGCFAVAITGYVLARAWVWFKA